MNKLNVIKFVVVLLTFLLIFGLLCIMGLLFTKAKAKNTLPIAEINIEEPIGSQIYNIDQFDNLLYITIKSGGLSDRIVIVDPKKGQKLTTITLN